MRHRTSLLAGALGLCLLAGPAATVRAQSETPAVSSAPAAYVGTNPPDGTYRADISYLDLVTKGASTSFAQDNQGPWTWTFADGSFALSHVGYGETCSGTYESDGIWVRLLTNVADGCGYDGDIQWAPAPDGIRILQLPSEGATDELADMTAYFDRVFVRVEDPS
jgi:hypothetical protein